MFQNSLPLRLTLRCPQHPKSFLVYMCTQTKCEGWPLFCEECRSSYRYKQRHYGHELSVVELSRGVEDLCSRLESNKKSIRAIHREMIQVKGVEGLLKWQEQKQQHFNSIQNHINTIKFQVEEQIANIITHFQLQLTKQKEKLYSELQNYYKNYREKFDKFSRLTEPIVAIQSKFKFYATPNSLFYKISSEIGQPKLGVWLSELKRTLSLSEKATTQPTQYSQQIRKYGQQANSIMDQLPRIRSLDYQKQMPSLLASSAQTVLKALVRLKQNKTIVRSFSVDGHHPTQGNFMYQNSYK